MLGRKRLVVGDDVIDLRFAAISEVPSHRPVICHTVRINNGYRVFFHICHKGLHIVYARSGGAIIRRIRGTPASVVFFPIVALL